MYSWPQALEKAECADGIVRQRLRQLGLAFDCIETGYLGVNACHGPAAAPSGDRPEVELRIGVRGQDRAAVERFAHCRSGDEGDIANIGVIALQDRYYPILLREVTAERVKAFFGARVKGRAERDELPNLGALNFLLYEALGGGGAISLRVDAQAKTFAAALLRMEIDVDEHEL